jgi:alpha-glucosidase
MLGDSLLVAPVVRPGDTQRRVYLPRGPEAWFDFETGTRYAAGQWHTVAAPLSKLPLFVRSGAALPLAQPRNGLARHDDPVTTVKQFG